MTNHLVQRGSIISGPTLPEAVEVLDVTPYGTSLKIIGRGLKTGRTYDPVLNGSQIAQLTISADTEPFDGDPRLFRLGIEAQRLGLAYEYDPFFSLSIARVDPLPHQLEADYGYFAAGRGELLKRFLVEDGIGKDARFWKLAQSLSALYPKECEEKRWVDGVLARKKGLGL